MINKTKEFLSYDINFQNLYQQAEDYYHNHIQAWINAKKEEEEENKTETKEQETLNEQVTNEETTNNEVANEQTEGGIGGGEEGEKLLLNEMVTTSANAEKTEETQPLTQMEMDANSIKENYSMILPLKGTVTSRFGAREPTEIVSANHAGIDIGANEGTVFIAAMEGKVTYVSSEGGYGNHVYIEKDDVITLYAHCSKIYVKEGDTITQGQQIGEVGHTGNTTGPHLHFEIRINGTPVNPQNYLYK